jgi:hypothetical protein
VSAITAGGLVPLDVSRLSQGSHIIIWLLFTCGGVTFTALPPMLWRVWLFRARFRPLIAQAQALTAELAALRAEEAAAAVRLAAVLAATAAETERRTQAAVAKAMAVWTAPGTTAAAAAAAAAAEVSDTDITLPSAAAPAAMPRLPSLPSLSRAASFAIDAAARPMRRTLSFFLSANNGSMPPDASDEAQAAAAAAAASEATRTAAAAAAFSEEDSADYAALSADFVQQNEALESVAAAVALYVLLWHVLGSAAFESCYAAEGAHLPLLQARGISPAWLAIFLVSSALNNTGLSLLDDSLISIALRPQSLMVLAAAILAGNTAWPVALRVMLRIWVSLCGAVGGEAAAAWRCCRGVRYALAHPQRCYHLLFDARRTAAVAAAVVLLLAFQLIFIYATSLGKATADLTELAAAQGRLPPSAATVGTVIFFQVVSVRTAGFQVRVLAHSFGMRRSMRPNMLRRCWT